MIELGTFPPQTKSGFHKQGEKETDKTAVPARHLGKLLITLNTLPNPALLSGLAIGSVEHIVKISSSRML